MPELILNNFTTRLGLRVGRMFASIFPQDPEFRGRRAVTFHNQRDFIFFRHHRYIFEEKEVKGKVSASSKDSTVDVKKRTPKSAVIARLQECGPRFTLKLQSLQHGTFDSKYGEYEWVHKVQQLLGSSYFCDLNCSFCCHNLLLYIYELLALIDGILSKHFLARMGDATF
jgi:ribosome production factor 1